MTSRSPEPWLGDDAARWYAGAQAWIEGVFRERDLGSPVEIARVKARPWSVVLRVSSPENVAFFKAACAGGSHEPGLLARLAEGWQEHVPALLEVHEGRAWMLMADAGSPLRDAPEWERVDALRRFLPVYAEMQIASTNQVDALLALGLPDRRVARLPAMVRALISGGSEEAARYSVLIEPVRPAVEALLPALERHCSEMGASPHAAALEHGDLHASNLMVRDGECRLCDWGDASIAHPFCSLLITLQMTLADSSEADRAKLACDLRDAYLEPWTALAPAEVLRSELGRALWIARIVRVLDWVHMLRGADAVSFERWAPHVAVDLSRWLEHHERGIDADLPLLAGG